MPNNVTPGANLIHAYCNSPEHDAHKPMCFYTSSPCYDIGGLPGDHRQAVSTWQLDCVYQAMADHAMSHGWMISEQIMTLRNSCGRAYSEKRWFISYPLR